MAGRACHGLPHPLRASLPSIDNIVPIMRAQTSYEQDILDLLGLVGEQPPHDFPEKGTHISVDVMKEALRGTGKHYLEWEAPGEFLDFISKCRVPGDMAMNAPDFLPTYTASDGVHTRILFPAIGKLPIETRKFPI